MKPERVKAIKEWTPWFKAHGISPSLLPNDLFEHVQGRYDLMCSNGEQVEAEVMRTEWANHFLNNRRKLKHNKELFVIYSLGNPQTCGYPADKFAAWEWFVLEAAWHVGVFQSTTAWAADESQMMVVGELDTELYTGRKAKPIVDCHSFRIEDQPRHVVETWAIRWKKECRRGELIEERLKGFLHYVRGGWTADLDKNMGGIT